MARKREFPLAQVYGLLEPGPVVLVTTARAGRANVMPLSWHTMMEFVPPLVGCVISNQNHTFEMLRVTGECAINVPTVELAREARRVLNEMTDPRQRLDSLLMVMDRLNDVRRADQRSVRLRMDQERWEKETDREELEESERRISAMKEKVFNRLWAPLRVATLAHSFGGSENDWDRAALWVETEYDLPLGTLYRKKAAGPTESSSIKVNQGESSLRKNHATARKIEQPSFSVCLRVHPESAKRSLVVLVN